MKGCAYTKRGSTRPCGCNGRIVNGRGEEATLIEGDANQLMGATEHEVVIHRLLFDRDGHFHRF